MADTWFRKTVPAVVIAAGLIRIAFLLSGEVLPVIWDARRYACAAIGMISYLDSSGPETSSDERADRYAFKHYYEKYIQGEPIDFQFYTPSSLTQARDDIFLAGPLYPALLAAIFALAPVADFTFARLLGILFDLGALWMLILVARRLAGRRAAIVGGVLYAIYFPFIQTSTVLLLETSTSFFILLGIYLLMRGAETDRRLFFTLAGVVCGLLVMHKPTAMFISIPLVVGFYFYTRNKLSLRRFIRRVGIMAVPALIMFAAWLTVASIKFDQPTLRDPSYAGANLRQSSSIEYEGYDLDRVDDDFWERQPYDDLIPRLPEYLGLFAKKFERLWSSPYIAFKRSFILPESFVRWLHSAVIFFGLIGMIVLLFRSFRLAVWPVLISGYYTAIHLIFHSLNRYSFNALPLLFIMAAWTVTTLYDELSNKSTNRWRHVLQAILLIPAGAVFEPSWVALLMGSAQTYGLVLPGLVFKAGFIGFALYILSRILLRDTGPLYRWLMVILVVIPYVVVVVTPVLSRDNWSEFACRIDDPEVRAGTRFYLSDLMPENVPSVWWLLVDMNVPEGKPPLFEVKIGRRTGSYILGQEPLRRHFYSKPTYTEYARLERIDIAAFRQYAFIELLPGEINQSIERQGYVDVSLNLTPSADAEEALYIYGTQGGASFIPSLTKTSVERHNHRGDPRIREEVKFMSDSVISYYIDSNGDEIVSGRDLSPSIGRQIGRYNMFLVRLNEKGEFSLY